MANEYDDVCTVHEVIIGVIFTEILYSFLWCLRNLARAANIVKLVAWKEVVQHNKT